jgi:large subunit ribosomal protein L25
MAEVQLEATVRPDTGKGSARQTRAAGRIPAILYGGGIEPRAISVDRRELLTAFHTDAGMNVLLELKIDGETTLAITRELQRDPVRGSVMHADFVKVDRTQEIEIEVPVHLVGESPGAKEGGVLEQPLFTVHVRCMVTQVPEAVDADISGLNIGDALRVSDLSEGREFQILNDPDTVVASVAAPITEEQLEAMTAEAGIVEEVSDAVLEELAEAEAAEEPAEGEAPAEGAPEQTAEEGDQS